MCQCAKVLFERGYHDWGWYRPNYSTKPCCMCTIWDLAKDDSYSNYNVTEREREMLFFGRSSSSSVITRLIVHFTCGLMFDLVICKLKYRVWSFGHIWHGMCILRPQLAEKYTEELNASFGLSSTDTKGLPPQSLTQLRPQTHVQWIMTEHVMLLRSFRPHSHQWHPSPL